MREAKGSRKITQNGGYLHVIHHHRSGRRTGPQATTNSVPTHNEEIAAAVDAAWRNATPGAMAYLAAGLRVSLASLNSLHAGYSVAVCGYTFPMTDGRGVILGARIRTVSGHKYSMTGGHEGIFVARNFTPGPRLIICEGPTDLAALLTIGITDAIGRPSCCGAAKLIRHRVEDWRPKQIIIISDADAPGRDGATALARDLMWHCPDVRIMEPPAGRKDMRAWVCCGAGKEEIEQHITHAAPVRMVINHSCQGPTNAQ